MASRENPVLIFTSAFKIFFWTNDGLAILKRNCSNAAKVQSFSIIQVKFALWNKAATGPRFAGWVLKFQNLGQWLWHTWQSGCFQHQRYIVRNQTSAKIYLSIVSYRKDENKEKEAGMGPFLYNFLNWYWSIFKYWSTKLLRLMWQHSRLLSKRNLVRTSARQKLCSLKAF